MSFYAGGFIYNPQTKKILLQLRDDKTKNNPGLWAFFGGTSKMNETPEETFLREFGEETGVKVRETPVKPLCNYFNSDFNTHRYIFYITTTQNLAIHLSEGKDTHWFNFDEVFYNKLSKRTIQDLMYFKEKVLA